MERDEHNGSLYLIPTGMGALDYERIFPEFNRKIILNIKDFIVEDIRSARRFLKSIGYPGNFDDVSFRILDKHTKEEDTVDYLKPLQKNKPMGLMSEAGVPCLADPGNIIVKSAHRFGFKIVPLIGPSSILLALIASGFNGQNFSFLGYLPVKTPERVKKIKEMEMLAQKSRKLNCLPKKQVKHSYLSKRPIATFNFLHQSSTIANQKRCFVWQQTSPSKLRI